VITERKPASRTVCDASRATASARFAIFAPRFYTAVLSRRLPAAVSLIDCGKELARTAALSLRIAAREYSVSRSAVTAFPQVDHGARTARRAKFCKQTHQADDRQETNAFVENRQLHRLRRRALRHRFVCFGPQLAVLRSEQRRTAVDSSTVCRNTGHGSSLAAPTTVQFEACAERASLRAKAATNSALRTTPAIFGMATIPAQSVYDNTSGSRRHSSDYWCQGAELSRAARFNEVNGLNRLARPADYVRSGFVVM